MNSPESHRPQARTGSAPRPPSATSEPDSVTEGAPRIALSVPFVGRLTLPDPEHVAYYLGIGALVALEVVEWPAALVLGLGHAMITQRNNQALRDFAQALEDVERG